VAFRWEGSFRYRHSHVNLRGLEHVLKEANPLVQELYVGTVENLQAQEAVEVNQLLTQTLEVQPVGS
jgi:hypothetical protein